MTWFSETFYWLPAVLDKPYKRTAIELTVCDGHAIELSMNDGCDSRVDICNCEDRGNLMCMGDGCIRRLSIEEATALRDALTNTINYYHDNKNTAGVLRIDYSKEPWEYK